MRKITNQELGRPSVEAFAQMSKCPVTVVLDQIRSHNNVGSFFRTGDAFAIEQIYLCGITGTPPHREIHKTALGAELTVPWRYCQETAEAVTSLRAEGYTLLSIEQVEGAISLDAWRFDPTQRYALIFGNEVDGVQQSIVDLCDGAIEIPQCGTKHSLNVSVSGGAVLWEAFRQWKQATR
ncbi:MAG: RNA methyltransferase [Alistipes sp.]|nr:RNA methyltransferase [Alistipes sp.]